jgi:sialic acid synthase SpsE
VIDLPDGRRIGQGQPTYIVAEIGQNHQGDVYTALRLIAAAVAAGCDAVKLCKRDVNSDLTPAAKATPYLSPNSFGSTYGEHREALELSAKDYRHLKDRIRYNGWNITLFASVCDPVSADQVEAAIDPPMYKIASRDLDNEPLIRHVLRLGKPVIFSCGMHELSEVYYQLTKYFRYVSRPQAALLHCVSLYPTPDHEAQLSRLNNEWVFGLCPHIVTGYSDHTLGIDACVAAVARGAAIVEKHITLSHSMPGSDHLGAAEPEELAEMVRRIRRTEAFVSKPCDAPLPRAVSTSRAKLGRSIVAAEPLARGATLAERHMALRSPGDGLPWDARYRLIQRVLKRPIAAGEQLRAEDVL